MEENIGNVIVTVTPQLDETAMRKIEVEMAHRIRVAVNQAIREAIKIGPTE